MLLAMPGRITQLLPLFLLLLFWMQADSTLAYSVIAVRQRSLPRLAGRALTQSSITLACKKATPRKGGSKAPKPIGKSTGFAAPPHPSPPQPNAPIALGATGVVLKDDLTLYQLGRMFADVLVHYKNLNEIPLETVRRNLLATRLEKLSLNRCRVDTSTISGAGQGLFASRALAVGELITCYPGDAVLCWEDEDHSAKRNIEVYHGKHIPSTEANALRFVHELRSYEVPASDTMSVLGDPILCGDAAYLGHMANDGASPDFSAREQGIDLFAVVEEEKERYDAASAARVNAEIIALEGWPKSPHHMVTKAVKPIRAGDEIFLTYGYGYWLSRRRA